MPTTGESLESMLAWSWTDIHDVTHYTKTPWPFHSTYRRVLCRPSSQVDMQARKKRGQTVTCFNCILEADKL